MDDGDSVSSTNGRIQPGLGRGVPDLCRPDRLPPACDRDERRPSPGRLVGAEGRGPALPSAASTAVVPVITGRTCRAARGLLDWTTRSLASRSGVPVSRILEIERNRPIDDDWRRKLRDTFVLNGVEIIEDAGHLVGVRAARGTRAWSDLAGHDGAIDDDPSG